jgi:aminoglycoside 3-N-acetyltransferase
MVIHRLQAILGKKGTLLMPTFTSVTRHSSTHDDFTKMGCWCEGKEGRHIPFIPELQPDKDLGEVAHRLCSWPASRRSRHPAYSFVAVGANSDELVRDYSLTDPLQPLRLFLRRDPFVLTIGVDLNSVIAIHLAEEKSLPFKFVKERALTVGSTGPTWVDVVALGCSMGFNRLESAGRWFLRETQLGAASARTYAMKGLVETAERLLEEQPTALLCGRPECVSCKTSQ